MASFDAVFRSEGAQSLQTPFRTPNANAYAERFVRTVRSACLGHLLIVNARHLERILRTYARHHNGFRPPGTVPANPRTNIALSYVGSDACDAVAPPTRRRPSTRPA
jgi:hypothetical protein